MESRALTVALTSISDAIQEGTLSQQYLFSHEPAMAVATGSRCARRWLGFKFCRSAIDRDLIGLALSIASWSCSVAIAAASLHIFSLGRRLPRSRPLRW